ncbi:MAG: glycoside hydrolase family 73 protein, partial [Stellaceae bacterium]
YWQDHGMRPLGGRSAATPIEPPSSPVAGLTIRPAVAGGAVRSAPSSVCQLPTAEASTPDAGAVIPPGAAPSGPPAEGGAGSAGASAATIADFAQRIGPALQRAAAQLGVSSRILLAQAALESGWGRSVVGNNLFGIKADPSWRHARIAAMTHEVRDGRPTAERASFRAYASLGDAVADYVALIADSPRYRAALGAGDDAQGYGEALVRGGYATDGDYAQKLAAVADSPALLAALRQLNPAGQPVSAATAG